MNHHTNPHALQPMIKESVDRFLNEYRKGRTDFSNFTSIFSRFLQKLPNPPLEIVWFYSALTFHSAKFNAQSSSTPVLMANNLFQLLVSCSSSCNAVKKIAVLAPVIYEVNRLVSEGDKWRKDIEGLLEVIFSYLSICCGINFEQEAEFGDLCCFRDLVGVWMVDRIGENCKLGEELIMFFPLVSDGIRKRMVGEGCEVGQLAGVVMAEAFLLRLCLKFGSGVSRMELEKELQGSAVQAITAFRSFYFVDVFLRMLLEQFLSVTSLLNSKDEVFLREVLYDVAIVEYSFLGSGKGIHLPEENLKNLAITWLFVAHNGVQFLSLRECGKKTKVVSYLQAFSESCLLSELFKWVMNQPGIQSKTSKPEVFSPLSLIEWLLILEDEGLRVFDNDISKIYAKAIISKSRKGYKLLATESHGKSLIENKFSYGDYEGKVYGDLEMIDSEATAFAGNLKTSATNGTKKRKEGMKDERNRQVKVVKCSIDDNSVTDKGSTLDDEEALSSGSEVDNPSSDENVDPMEQ